MRKIFLYFLAMFKVFKNSKMTVKLEDDINFFNDLIFLWRLEMTKFKWKLSILRRLPSCKKTTLHLEIYQVSILIFLIKIKIFAFVK